MSEKVNEHTLILKYFINKNVNYYRSLKWVIIFLQMEFWSIVRIIKMWHRDTKWTNAIEKMMQWTFSIQGYHKPSICKKKHNVFQEQ